MTQTFFEEPNLQSLLEKIARDEGFEQPTFSIGNASKPGQNFIGRVLRALITERIDGKMKSLSLIFKASSTNRQRQEMMGGDRLFQTEKDMYEIVLPTLNNFLKKHGIVDNPIFPGTPRCFATEMNSGLGKEVADIIVLEDKSVDGFEVVGVKSGLNGEQCRLALERVALLHSSSMALHELEPETAKYLRDTIDKKFAIDDFKAAFEDLKRGFMNGLDMLDEPYKPGNRAFDKLRSFYETFAEDLFERWEPVEDIRCITHTDFSANNILFKINNDGSTEEACVIDFQTATSSSFANDLAILLFMCTTKAVREEHFENLLQFYYTEVTNTLRAFGCDPDKVFPWELFQKHLNTYMKFGAVFSIFALPVMLAEEFSVDIHSSEGHNAMFSETAKVTNPETKKELQKRINDVVSDSVRLGYL